VFFQTKDHFEMSKKIEKILFFGQDDNYGLCPSYLRSSRAGGYQTELFQYDKELFSKSRWNFLKRRLINWVNVEIWLQQLNRKFLIKAKQMRPDLIVSVTNAPIRPASLLFLRSILPDTRFVLLWPDSLANLQSHVFAAAPLYDFVASYGRAGTTSFLQAGFRSSTFVPLAGDPRIHWQDIQNEYDLDLSFVGGWRPEREQALAHVHKHFPHLKMRVIGPNWPRLCQDKALKQVCVNGALFGSDLARFFQRSRININVIDDTNFPSANMRFFEIPTAGGLQISTSCPDMQDEFREKEHVIYVERIEELEPAIQWALENPKACSEIRRNSQELVRTKHNYDQRLNDIINFAQKMD
jgi:glycosyltransferase involved in cell wall biosynthesis